MAKPLSALLRSVYPGRESRELRTRLKVHGHRDLDIAIKRFIADVRSKDDQLSTLPDMDCGKTTAAVKP